MKILYRKSLTRMAVAVFSIFALSACSDWTEVESVDLKEPDVIGQNPELYAKYLQNLREYKQTEHKLVYAWFDNSEKVPFNRAQHLTILPDSIDVVSLMYPDELADWELKEIEEVREQKGTKIICTIDFDAIKAAYNAELEKPVEEEPVTEEFNSYLLRNLEYQLSLVEKYNYDGICIGYSGKSILHMPEDEALEYKGNEKLFTGVIADWHKRNATKTLDYLGDPQNLINKSLLQDCRLILVSAMTATATQQFSKLFIAALGDDIPKERIGMLTTTVSTDEADITTGYLSDGTRAIVGLGEWAAAPHGGVEVAGIGIYNVSTDYYNPVAIYKYTREAINAVNPSIK